MEDSADNYARGHYTEGRKHLVRVSDQLRRLVEACDSIQVEYCTSEWRIRVTVITSVLLGRSRKFVQSCDRDGQWTNEKPKTTY